MSGSISPQQALREATQVLANITAATQRLENNAPAELLQETHTLMQDGAKIAELQRRLQATYARVEGGIQGATNADIVTLTTVLSSATDQVSRIEANSRVATDIMTLGSDIEQLLARNNPDQINPTEARSLVGRITTMNRSPDLSQGNRQALRELSQLLPGARQAPASSSSNAAASQIRAERTAQDGEHQVALLTDQCNTLERSLIHIPVEDFPRTLDFYRVARRVSQGVHGAQQPIQEIVQKVERCINAMIEEQADQERITREELQNQESGSASLRALSAALRTVIAAGQTPSQELIAAAQTAFADLDSSDKPRLLQALNTLLTQANVITRPLQPTVLGQPIATWRGTWEQKLAALTTILPPQPQPAPVVEHANTMLEQFMRAQRAAAPAERPQAPAPGPTPAPVRAQRPTPVADRPLAPAPVRTQQPPQVEVYDPTAFDSPARASIRRLEEVLPLLHENSTPADLQQALLQLTLLESQGNTAAFRVTASRAAPITDRTHFHLYLIHREERGQLPADMSYGSNAMAGVYPTTNTERQRAISRTIAELALEHLDEAINFIDEPEIVAMLEILEGLRMDRRDLAEGQQNIAHTLFGQLYHLHVAARQATPSLVDPHHAMFQGDFGRVGFRTTDAGIDPAVKLRAVHEMLQALKATWRA